MEGAVVVDENRGFGLGGGQSRVFENFAGDMRVDSLQSGEQAACQHRLLVVTPFRGVAVNGDVWAVSGVVAPGAEPFEAELFEVVFGDHVIPTAFYAEISNYLYFRYFLKNMDTFLGLRLNENGYDQDGQTASPRKVSIHSLKCEHSCSMTLSVILSAARGPCVVFLYFGDNNSSSRLEGLVS